MGGGGCLSGAGRRRCEVKGGPAAVEWDHPPALSQELLPLGSTGSMASPPVKVHQVFGLSPPLTPLPAPSLSPLAFSFPASAQAPPAPGHRGWSLNWVVRILERQLPHSWSSSAWFALESMPVFSPTYAQSPLTQVVYLYVQLDLYLLL